MRIGRSAAFALTCTVAFGTVVFFVHRIQQDERLVSPLCQQRLFAHHFPSPRHSNHQDGVHYTPFELTSPPQIMRKGVLNDLERQTRAIERKTQEAHAASQKGET